MAGLNSPRLFAYAALLFLAIGIVQLAGSLAFYRAIDEQTLREDHARRVAEMLVVSDRVHAVNDALTSPVMTTRHLQASVSPEPTVRTPQQSEAIERITRQIVSWEPALAGRTLNLAIKQTRSGRRDLIGSIRLADGDWLNFQSLDISSMWPVALRAITMTLVTYLICVSFGLIALRLLTKPLRHLSEAAEAIGRGQRVPIRPSGPGDLRDLAVAMNEMQGRIAGLLEDQAKSFAAIGHDLRTPLSRQKIAADLIDDAEIGALVHASADEMEAMLQSLQEFLRAQHLTADPEPVDLVASLRDLLSPWGERVRLSGADAALAETYREPLLLSLKALLENAMRFGTAASVTIARAGQDWIVTIEDDGPGLTPDHFGDVLTPFWRLDEARSRDTKGFGLGIPTAHRLLTRFGGRLDFAEAAGGGLAVRVTVPRPPA